MDIDLRCNNLSCRKTLTEKAVVTTCSHIFCVECANALFTASHICPACEAPLSEPDDVVITSLRPTNDYKTSVLSGLSPGIILEVCSRAIAFWQYQVHQEGSYQQAVLKTLNDKNLQITRQLDNVVREANGELGLLKNKITGLERELDDEKRKTRELQVALREKDKEYQKLKTQLDKLKRKALFVPGSMQPDVGPAGENSNAPIVEHQHQLGFAGIPTGNSNRGFNAPPGPGINRMADNMETFRIQRTPVKQSRSGLFGDFRRSQLTAQRSIYDKTNVSDTSENEIDGLLGYHHHQGMRGGRAPAIIQPGSHGGIKMRNEVRSNVDLH